MIIIRMESEYSIYAMSISVHSVHINEHLYWLDTLHLRIIRVFCNPKAVYVMHNYIS